jgi:hypothetical protein
VFDVSEWLQAGAEIFDAGLQPRAAHTVLIGYHRRAHRQKNQSAHRLAGETS